MSITINARGTSVPSFTIGKNGVTIYQGSADPSLSYTINSGDYWLETTDFILNVWNGTTWQAPQLANLNFTDNTIVAATGEDLNLSIGVDQYVNIDAGNTGPALITASSGQDLHINPAIGGGQYLWLNANKWPVSDGSENQVLTTNGAGNLSFITVNTVGTASPATTATTGFAYIPVTSGTPTGTPDTITGFVPLVADSSGSKLWVYIGGIWKSTTLS